MSFASSSTSSFRSCIGHSRHISSRRANNPSSSSSIRIPSRSYTPAAQLQEQPIPADAHTPNLSSSSTPSSFPSRHSRSPQPFASTSNRNSNSTTPEQAQTYLSNLLHLPSNSPFPAELALQILTHKSYRFSHVIRHKPLHPPFPPPSPSSSSSSSASTDTEFKESIANHNSRLSFLGRRALASYLAMFIHSSISSMAELRDIDFLRGKSLEAKLENLRHVNNVGRVVGGRWGVGEVMRWDHNSTASQNDAIKIKGMTTEAILGGIYTQFGSPAAQRCFHLMILPFLAEQMRDPRLIERVEMIRGRVGGIVRGEGLEGQEKVGM